MVPSYRSCKILLFFVNIIPITTPKCDFPWVSEAGVVSECAVRVKWSLESAIVCIARAAGFRV